MTAFVDPRSNPLPPCQVSREPAAHGEELRGLIQHCAAGRVYDVERWIQDGQPIQALSYKRPGHGAVVSPLRTAIRKKHPDVALLLLCNGYQLELEDAKWHSPLDEALTVRAFDLVDLLLTWGADPRTAKAVNVVDTYKTDLIDRFWTAGLDYTADPEFVQYLAHTANKPLYGWTRRHRADQRLQDALDVALVEAVTEDAERPVHLLLWAGADPHRRVPSLRALGQPHAWDDDWVCSAAEVAIIYGRRELLDRLRVSTMPSLEAQAQHANDAWTLKKLVGLSPPTDWSAVVLSCIRWFSWPGQGRSSWDAREALTFIASSGGKFTTVAPDQLRYLRRSILELKQADDFLWLLRWLKNEKHCARAIYEELVRTASMRKKIAALSAGVRYLSPSQRQLQAATRRRQKAARKMTP